MERGSFQLMKSVNKSLVLNKIRTSQPISRAQIAKDTQLTPPTVSSIVRELMGEALVIESSLGESRGGRKPTMLLINEEAFYVIGVDAGPDTLTCMVGNLAGDIVERAKSKHLTHSISKDQFLGFMVEMIRSVLDSLPDPNKVMGIGVAMHGVVDVDEGKSLVTPNLGLYDIPIRDVLEKEFNMMVKVENDVRAMALGEAWFNEYSHKDSMMMVNLGSGVGAGLVINGKLYHGAADLAGEVGHMTISLNGAICSCGNRGCFQTFASGEAVVNRAKAALSETIQAEKITEKALQENRTDLSRFLNKDVSVDDIYQAAVAGNEILVQVLKETGQIIGIALTNLIHVINPDRIVLGGSVSKMGTLILPAIKDTIKQRGLTEEARQTPVDITSFGQNATLMGAISLLLVELFEPA